MSNVNGDNTIDLTPREGMDLRSLGKTGGTPFLQNVITRNGELAVRPGFGTVRQYGTTLNGGRIDQSTAYGLAPCIGATHVRTGWETDQILAIHPVYAFSGNLKTDSAGLDVVGRFGAYFAGIAAVVHDLHTGHFCEFVLHTMDAQTDDIYKVYPHYAIRGAQTGTTERPQEHSAWVVPPRVPEWAVFAPAVGNVVIAIDGVGLCTYRPVEFTGPLDRKARSMTQYLLPYGPGENGVFAPLNLCEGFDGVRYDGPAGMAYFRQVELGQVTAMCSWLDRTVYASGNSLLFSNPGRPDNIRAESWYTMPTQDEITCVAGVRDVLFVATARGCWVCQPEFGATAFSMQNLVQISSNVGCVTNRAAVSGDDGVYFVEDTGVYLFRGGTSVIQLSAPIDRLWTDPQSLQMVLTDYYVANGLTGLNDEQLPARIDIREQMANARLAWNQDGDTLYCVCDDVTLVWTGPVSVNGRSQGFGWGIWSFQTHSGDHTEVQGVQNVRCPTFVVVNGRVFALGGTDDLDFQHWPFDLPDGSSVFDPYVNNRTCYLLELGRGGALDRSIDAESVPAGSLYVRSLENDVEPAGGWTQYTGTMEQGAFFIGKPTVMPPMFDGPNIQTNRETFWFPVYVHRDDIDITTLRLWFSFDNVLWEPVLRATNGVFECQLDALFPNERIGSADGWGDSAPFGTSRQIRVYNGAGALDPAGEFIQMDFEGGLFGTWTYRPGGFRGLNAQVIGPAPLVYLPFKRKAFQGSLSLVTEIQDAELSGVGVARVYVWNFYDGNQGIVGREQCVDWAIKTAEATAKGMQVKVRGVLLEAMHHGNQTGSDALKPNWLYGPLNTATSTDMRDYCAQATDFTAVGGNSEQRGILPTARLMPQGASSLVTKVGNGSARWGDVGDATAGNLLIDDAAVDKLATTDGSQGERASVLLHGTMDAPGEGVRIGKVDVVMRVTGAIRRWR